MSKSTQSVYGGSGSSTRQPVFGSPSNAQLAKIIVDNPDSAAAKATINPGGGKAAAAAVLALLADTLYCPPPVCDMTEQTTLLLSLLDSIYSTVDRLFPLITITAKHLTDAEAATFIKPRTFCRLYWAQQHKGMKFGGTPANPITLQIHLLQLKDVYLMLDLDLSLEPLFKLLAPPVSSPPVSSPPVSSPPPV